MLTEQSWVMPEGLKRFVLIPTNLDGFCCHPVQQYERVTSKSSYLLTEIDCKTDDSVCLEVALTTQYKK